MLCVRFKNDVKYHRAVYGLFNGDISYRREYQISSMRESDRIFAIAVCRCTRHSAFKVDGCIGDRLSVGIINDRSRYVDFLSHCDAGCK